MSTEPKNLGGRPEKPSDKKLKQRSIRMLPAQWDKVDACGGVPWLRDLVDSAPTPASVPARKKPRS